jgi:phosphate transport system permease protein
VAGKSMFLAAAFANSIVLLIAFGLFIKSRPILAQKSILHLLLSSSWHPLKGDFGFYPFIIGTLEVTTLGMILSVPVCLLSAIYLSEYVRSRWRDLAHLVIGIMAAIPSVVYGLWGVIVVVPFVRALGDLLDIPTTGYSLLAGGIILAIMVSPIIISVSMEVLRTVSIQARETALALGATRWQAIKHVILRSAFHGVFSAVVLGFARAFGETIAVLMIVGNVPRVPKSIFDPAYPLPAGR